MAYDKNREYAFIGGAIIVLASAIWFIYPAIMQNTLGTSGINCQALLNINTLTVSNNLNIINLVFGLLIILTSYFDQKKGTLQTLSFILPFLVLLVGVIIAYNVYVTLPHLPVSDCFFKYTGQPSALYLYIILLLIGAAIAAYGSYNLIKASNSKK